MDKVRGKASKRYPHAVPPLKKVPNPPLVARIAGILIVFTCFTSTHAATVTVGPTGTYATLNAALEALDYNDGADDLVLIEPGTYDEQIAAKGNAGADSSAYPPAISISLAGIENAYSSHSDPLTIRGADPASPPVLTCTSPSVGYGFFPSDPGDVQFAQIIICGNDITFQNVEIRQNSTEYGIAGMGSAIVFEDCLFSNDNNGASHDDFIELVNNGELTSASNITVYADNEFHFRNCEIDLEDLSNPGTYYHGAFLYFHGFYDGLNLSPVGAVTFDGCIIRNLIEIMVGFRGYADVGTGLGYFAFTDNFVSNIAYRNFLLDGNIGPVVVERNIFSHMPSGVFDIDDKGFELPQSVLIANNVFADIGGNAMDFDLSGTPVNVPTWQVINNTFFDYSMPPIDVGGTNAGTVILANNIFAASDVATGVTAVNITASISPEVELYSNLYHNNGSTLSDLNSRVTVTSGELVDDPLFANTTVIEPALPGDAFPGEPFQLSSGSPARDSGNFGYAVSSLGYDVDSSTRFYFATVDRGAQEYGAPTPTPTVTPTPDPAATGTPTTTPTITLTPIPTLTPTPTYCIEYYHVGPGQAYTTINAALEAIDYNDGCDDVVLVEPGTYDEQIVPKGNAGLDSVAFPQVSVLTTSAVRACIATHTDHLTIQGSDPEDPPLIQTDSAVLAPYGFFPSNLDDYAFATFVLAADGVTMKNVELRTSDPEEYALYGMASNFIWEDCLFSNGSGPTRPNVDFGVYRGTRDFNSDNDPLIGLDNEFIYSNCVIDGSEVDYGTHFDGAFVWSYRYGTDAPSGSAVGSGVTFDSCVVRNWDYAIHAFTSPGLGGTRGGIGPTLVQDCFFEHAGRLFLFRGACEDITFIRNVIYQPNPVDAGDGVAIQLIGRNSDAGYRGFTKTLVAANNLFVGAKDNIQFRLELAEAVETSADPQLHIVNNTFWDYKDSGVTSPLIQITERDDGVAQLGTVNISNNIFAATDSGSAGTAIEISDSSITGQITYNLFHNNVMDVTNTSFAVVSGSISGNPGFDGTMMNIPSSPPEYVASQLQQFIPSAFAVDAGSNSAYALMGGAAGAVDVDSGNERFGNATIDIGAQESNGASLVTPIPTPTETGTPDPSWTSTPTPNPTQTSTPTATACIHYYHVGPAQAYTTINAALEAIDYNDGCDDVVLIDPGVYDEQVVPKGNAGADSVAFPVVGSLTTAAVRDCIATHTDHLTIQGSDPEDPPLIHAATATLAPYGFFPSNLSDFAYSTLVFAADGVTMRNVELRTSDPNEYAMNGMASNFIWEDCIFSNGSGPTGPGVDFGAYRGNRDFNSDNDPLIGLDNEYIYSNCLIDGSEVDYGTVFDTAFGWFNGYGGDTPSGTAVGSGVTFDGCVVRNRNSSFHGIRSDGMGGTRGGIGPTLVQDCFFQDAGTLFRFYGACEDITFVRNVIAGTTPGGGEVNGSVLLLGRSSDAGMRGFTETLVFANNLMANISGSSQVVVELHEAVDLAADPQIHIVNNTFWNYRDGLRALLYAPDRSAPTGGTVNVANNIFYATDTGTVGEGIEFTNPDLTGQIVNNLFYNNVTDVTNTSSAVVSGSLSGDPGFNGTQVNIPSSPPDYVASGIQQFVPSALAVDAGSNSAYALMGGAAGTVDVDSGNERFGNATIDIGAQESNGEVLIPPTSTPTETQTPGPSATATSTPTPTLTNTSTPTSTPSPTPMGCYQVYHVGPAQPFTTINAALEAIDYNDGCKDFVLIEPGVYDEQIAAKGNAGADSSAYPPAVSISLAGIENSYSSHSDLLVFQGADPGNPPVLTCTSPSVLYGFFPNDPNDYQIAQIAICGNGITFKNVEVRYESNVSGYGIAGMGAEIVFEDCLFTNGSNGASAEDFISLGNNSELTSTINPTVAADNEVNLINCDIDMEDLSQPGTYYGGWFLYFHGFSDGFNLSPVGGMGLRNCIIRNMDKTMVGFRGHVDVGTGLAYLSFTDSFVSNIAPRSFNLRGNIGPVTIERNVFSQMPDDVVEVQDRFGELPETVLIGNNVFADVSGNPVSLNFTGTPANTAVWQVVNNTFFDYSAPAVDVEGTAAGTAIIANNIFDASSVATGVTAVNVSASGLPTVKLYSNLYYNNGSTVSDPNSRVSVNTGETVGDPLFANTTVTEPSAPGDGFGGEPFNLTSGSPARDTGNNAHTQGLYDVDGSIRTYSGTVDRGAQEYGAPTPTPTVTRTPLPTHTPTSTPTPAPVVWVDFAYNGTEQGTLAAPFNTLAEAVAAVLAGGSVKIKGDTAVTETDETPRITKAMRIEAVGGNVRIGDLSAKRALREGEEDGSRQPSNPYDLAVPGDRIDARDLLRLLKEAEEKQTPNRTLFEFSRQWMREGP